MSRDPGAYIEHSLIGSARSRGCLTAAVEDLKRRGFTEDFAPAGDRLRGATSGRMFAPDDLVIREHHRFEGMSDPDDMSVVYAIESGSGVRGTLVDAFGVYASPAVAAILARIPIRPKRAG
jgi:hypothetical protein